LEIELAGFIETKEGFIPDDELWTIDERACQIDLALLSMRELTDRSLGSIIHVDDRENVVQVSSGWMMLREALLQGVMWSQEVVLEDDSGGVQKLLLFVSTKEVQVMPIEHYFTLAGFDPTQETFDQGALPRASFSLDQQTLTFPNLYRQIFADLVMITIEREVLELQHEWGLEERAHLMSDGEDSGFLEVWAEDLEA